MEIGASTRLLAVLGDPVAQSLSPCMHNAAIRALGLDAAYMALHTPATALPTVLQALAAVGAAGNVTLPHKEATERYVARKTELCARVGACNTFWKESGPLPIPPTQLNGARAALDLVYAPGETPWVRALRAVGIPARDGRELLVYQGAAAFSRFFPGEVPPLDVMRAAVARALRA